MNMAANLPCTAFPRDRHLQWFCTPVIAVILFLSVAAAGGPRLLTNYSEAREFFGGRDARMVITKKDSIKGKNLDFFYLDFSEDPLVFKSITAPEGQVFAQGSVDGGGPSFSPDGTRLAYRERSNNSICIRWAREGESEFSTLPVPGYEPRWWVHPSTGDEYVIWVSTKGGGQSTIQGKTYMQKIRKGEIAPEGSHEILFDGYAIRGGRSSDGRFMYTAFPGWAMLEMDPEAVKNATPRFLIKRERLCNTSPYPGPLPRFIHLTGYHDYMYKDPWWPSPVLMPEGTKRVDFTEWSNHRNFIAGAWNNDRVRYGGAHEDSVWAMVYSTSDRKWLRVAKSARAGYLWVQPKPSAVEDPVFSVNGEIVNSEGYYGYAFQDSAVLTLSGPSNAKIKYALNSDSLPFEQWKEYSTPLSVSNPTLVYAVCIPHDESGWERSHLRKFMLTRSSWYDGLIFGTPPNDFPKQDNFIGKLPSFDKAFSEESEFSPVVTFVDGAVEPRGTSADMFVGVSLEATRSIKRALLKAETSLEGVAVQGSNAGWNKGYETISHVEESTTEATVEISDTRAFRFYRVQFTPGKSHLLKYFQFEFGDMDPNMLSAPSVLPGGGTFSDSIQVAIETSAPGAHIRYTLDGSSPTASSQRYTDPIVLKTTTTVSAVSVRNDTISPQTKVVFTKAAAQVKQPVFEPAEAEFDEMVTVSITSPTSGAQIFYSTDGTTPTEASTLYEGPLTIENTTLLKATSYHDGMAPSAPEWGLYVTTADAASGDGAILSPNGGEVFGVGDTVTVQWQTYNPDLFNTAVVHFTTDHGISFASLSQEKSIDITGDGWGSFTWVIEPEHGDVSSVSNQCRVAVSQYNGAIIDVSDETFTIGSVGAAQTMPVAPTHSRQFTQPTTVTAGKEFHRTLAEASKEGRVRLYTVQGRRINIPDRLTPDLTQKVSEGIYILHVTPEKTN